MNNDMFSFDVHQIHGTDSNSLLRLFDMATVFFNRSTLQLERAKADKVIQSIAKELRKRNVHL